MPFLPAGARRRSRATLPVAALAFCLAIPGAAALAQTPSPPGAIAGRVVTLAGEPVAGATVELIDRRRSTVTAADGGFRFADIAAGSYLLEVESSAAGSAVERVEVEAGAAVTVEIALSLARHDEEIVVTASADPRSQLELAQPTSVVTGEELAFRLRPTLGETLATEPGVASTSFGAGASRPVIRGLGGDRVRMLEGGLGAGDVSSTSPDHAVAIDVAAAERVEVLRGPSTLLYGSSAIGGVVNVIDRRIPEAPVGDTTGSLSLRGGTVDDSYGVSLDLAGGDERWAWHLDGQHRDTGDYEIPGFAESAALRESEEHEEHEAEEEIRDVLPNSDVAVGSLTAGLSRFFGDFWVGMSVSGMGSEYGVPAGGHGHGHDEGEGDEHEDDEHEHDDEAEGEDAVRIDLGQLRFDLRSELDRAFGPFRGARLRLGVVDYEHDELEGAAEEVATRFRSDSWEGRGELIQERRGRLTGSIGLQASGKELEVTGEEAYLPPTESRALAVFTFQELDLDRFALQLGGRFESSRVEAERSGVDSRTFDGLSASVGLVWRPDEVHSVGLSLARSTKAPNAEELFSAGPHFATRAFEVGDAELGEETSLGIDLALRRRAGPIRGELSLFYNRFDDFIYQQLTGEMLEDLPVLRYVQDDAEFLGAELAARSTIWESGSRHLDTELTADWVRAELANGEPLPRIPPLRFALGLHYHTADWHLFVEARRVEEQDRVAAEELPTPGYTMLGAGASYRMFLGDRFLDVVLRLANLTDEEARNHVSFLKDEVPLPGRDVSLAVKLSF